MTFLIILVVAAAEFLQHSESFSTSREALGIPAFAFALKEVGRRRASGAQAALLLQPLAWGRDGAGTGHLVCSSEVGCTQQGQQGVVWVVGEGRGASGPLPPMSCSVLWPSWVPQPGARPPHLLVSPAARPRGPQSRAAGRPAGARAHHAGAGE